MWMVGFYQLARHLLNAETTPANASILTPQRPVPPPPLIPEQKKKNTASCYTAAGDRSHPFIAVHACVLLAVPHTSAGVSGMIRVYQSTALAQGHHPPPQQLLPASFRQKPPSHACPNRSPQFPCCPTLCPNLSRQSGNGSDRIRPHGRHLPATASRGLALALPPCS